MNIEKKIAWLRYKDFAFLSQKKGKSYKEITSDINYRLTRTKQFKNIKLSKTFVFLRLKKGIKNVL